MKRWVRRILIALAIVLTLTALFFVWLVNSNGGARFVLARSIAATEGRLTIAEVEGTLAGPLTLRDLRWRDAGVEVSVGHAELDVELLDLLGWKLHLSDVEIADVKIGLTTQTAPPSAIPATPMSLAPPLPIILDRLHLDRAAFAQDGQARFIADSFDLAASWTEAGVVITRFSLRAPEGAIDLDGNLTSLSGYSGASKARVHWRVGDLTIAGSVDSVSDGHHAKATVTLQEPVPARATIDVDQDAGYRWQLDAEVPAFDPKLLAKDTTLKTLAFAVRGSGDEHGAQLSAVAQINGHRILLDPLQIERSDQTLVLKALTLRSAESPGQVDVNGRFDLQAKPPSAALAIEWNHVELPADLVGQTLATRGKLDFNGDAKAFSAKGTLALGPAGKLSDIAVDLTGSPQAIVLNRLALLQPKGSFDASGKVILQPRIEWDIAAKAHHFDPSTFSADWPGSLDFDLASSGHRVDDSIDALLKLSNVGGSLRQRPVTGTADLHIKPNFVVDGTLALASGESNLAVRGSGGEMTDATVGFTLASLADLLPDSQGRLHGELRLQGHWPALAVDGHVDGTGLTWHDYHAANLAIAANIKDSSKPGGTVNVIAENVIAAGLSFDRVALDGRGDAANHAVNIDATGTPLSLRMALSGSTANDKWAGTLSTLDLAIKDQPEWKLQHPANLSLNAGNAALDELCLGAGAARLCAGGNSSADGAVAARYRIEQLPLAMIAAIVTVDSPLQVQGVIGGNGDLHRSKDGILGGTAKLASPDGTISYVDKAAQPLIAYTGLAIDADLAPGAQRVDIHADLSDGGSLRGNVSLDGADQRLAGQINLIVNNLSFVELFSSELASVKGRLDAKLLLSGTVAAPNASGAIELKDFATEVPSAGLKLHDGALRVDAQSLEQLRVGGSIASGEGTLKFSGSGGLDAKTPLLIEIEGNNFLAVDIPAARVVIVPKLKLTRDAERLSVTGEVEVPRANVDLTRLPGGGAAQTSPDVVIADAGTVKAGEPLPVFADVTLRLGENVKLKGFGLDGSLAGQLAVIERPGKQTIGRGEIRVAGTYKAYGQDLKIQTGRLLFASTAIDNPGLDLRAVRELKDVTAGLRVQGTAQVPVLTVFAEPAMEQSEALSYLITGRPLSALKSGEGDLVGAAAQALGSATGDLLAKSVGARLGVDAAVSDNAAIGGAAFTVGKYLSPKLYLSYGVGLFTPGEVITLRYKLSKRWELEAQNATTENRAGINYRFER
ncbi:MAG: translocation/assembly module TamB domain-containing protein [Tahibacter sp.]